jgi:hypothetical protein
MVMAGGLSPLIKNRFLILDLNTSTGKKFDQKGGLGGISTTINCRQVGSLRDFERQLVVRLQILNTSPCNDLPSRCFYLS